MIQVSWLYARVHELEGRQDQLADQLGEASARGRALGIERDRTIEERNTQRAMAG